MQALLVAHCKQCKCPRTRFVSQNPCALMHPNLHFCCHLIGVVAAPRDPSSWPRHPQVHWVLLLKGMKRRMPCSFIFGCMRLLLPTRERSLCEFIRMRLFICVCVSLLPLLLTQTSPAARGDVSTQTRAATQPALQSLHSQVVSAAEARAPRQRAGAGASSARP